MKKLAIGIFLLSLLTVSAFAQEAPAKKEATKADNEAVFDADGTIQRGAALAKEVALADVLADPSKFEGESVRVSGFIVRSCKTEGCWAELGVAKDSKKTVRVAMKDHSFFIPLQSAGFKAVAEGVFTVETISKEKVKHLMDEDGATFENINADGTVTEVSFTASGIVLSKE